MLWVPPSKHTRECLFVMPAVMKDSLGWQGRYHNWLRQMMFLIWRTMYFNFPAQGLSWDTTYMRTVSCLFTGDKMQSSYIALREVLSVREERELPKWPTEPSRRAAGQWQRRLQRDSACPAVAPGGPAGHPHPRRSHPAPAAPVGAPLTRGDLPGYFCCSGSRGKAGRGAAGDGCC